MMVDANDHSACVNAWVERAANGLSSERLVHSFERAFSALWRRAHHTLGDVTLIAIADRVLYNAAEHYPILSSLRVEATGLRSQKLRDSAQSLPREQLAAGIRFVLVELLTILGNLTSEILTPALHAELAKMGPEDTSSSAQTTPPNADGTDGEGATQ
jgi:hypothetical protein